MIGRWLCRQGFHAWELVEWWRFRPVERCRRCLVKKEEGA